ncbi:sensor domain-containing diguanylate cyclase [Stutzerimonas zhaodongensis]|uniref:sensor domain-containing diguanylate cyclase n=1 Tax=Stutzerimonas TaxID=2901164 RepID=UPI003890C7DA
MTSHDATPEAYQREIKRLQEIIAHNSDWLWEVDAQGRYTFCSEHSLQMLGYPPSEVLGRTPFDFMPAKEAERVGQAFAEIVAQQRPFAGLINRNLRADGRLVVLETSGIPLFAEDGSLRGYRGIDRDITPAIGSLSPRIVQLEALYAAAPVALGLVDREGRFVNANHALTRLLGVDGMTLAKRAVADYLSPDQLDVPSAFMRLEAGQAIGDLALALSGRNYQIAIQAVRDHDVDQLVGMTLAITDVTEQYRLRQELAEANQRMADANACLSEMADTDHLTGLLNRRRFDKTLMAEVARSMRSGEPLSLMLLDIDFFKLYNDHYGHQAGDECLRTLARLLGDGVFRPGDLASRYGGEEFAVILPNADGNAAERVAARLRARLKDEAIVHVGAPTQQITASIGIATLAGDQALAMTAGIGETAARLINIADCRLYVAKRGGRDQVSIANFDSPGRTLTFERLRTANVSDGTQRPEG